MTTETEIKKPTPNKEVMDLGQRIKEAMLAVDPITALTVPKEPIYEICAKADDLTLEQIGKVKNFDTKFVAGTTWALGSIGIEALDKNSEMNHVSGEVPMYGGDSFKVSISRSVAGRNPRTGEAVTTYGAIKTEYTQTTGSNSGQMAKVRASLRQLGDELLNKGN